MNLEDILDLDTGLKYKFYHEFTEYYELSYFQKKNELNSEVEKNTLPLLEEEYSDGIGELIYNDDDEIVFDPNQEIEEGDNSLKVKRIYTSKTFINKIKGKIIEYMESGDGEELEDVIEWLGVYPSHCGFEDLCEKIDCDFDMIEEKEFLIINNKEVEGSKLLWYTLNEIDYEEQNIFFEKDV
tara:strand:+ start:192 stop:740 length:549 start_codon:yes stop_codon:yes gene_type:complete